MSAPVVIVDMQISNLGSVLHALARVGAPPHELATPANIGSAAAVLLPGVGAFNDGMTNLREKGFIEPIRHAAAAGVPVLGICLGMQLLADRSEEFGVHPGLGLISGEVKRLSPRDAVRVPNIGWCDVRATRESTLFPHAKAGCYYHVHSYHFVPADAAAIAATMNFAGDEVVVAVEQRNLCGVQFHPEKSQDDGLQVLSNFFTSLRRSGRVH